MTREDAQRSTDGQDVLNLATNLAGLRTSEDDPLDQKARRGAFNPEKANTPEPVVDDDDDEGIAPAIHPEGFLDEPEGDEEGAPPKEDCVLFVGDLARAISDADLERAFSSMGNVVMTDIKRDKVTGRNLGYGFVQMSTREEALAARERMQGAEIQGRRIRVGWAQRNTMLFVGDLDETVTLEVLAETFGRFGPLIPDHTYVRSGKFGRYGGVRFQSRQHAETARREMNGVRLGAFPIRVAWHHTQPGGPSIHHGAPVFIGGGGGGGGGPPRPYSVHVQFEADPNEAVVTEALMHSIFAPFGEVMAVILPQGRGILSHEGDSPNGPCCRGYGFIHFPGTGLGRKCALEAIRALNGQVVHGVRLSTSFSKKPTGAGPRPSSAPPGRMGGRPLRRIMMMDHHAGGVGDVAMGFRPIAMPSPTDLSGGMGFGGGYPGMDGPGPSGGRGGGGSWGPPMQHYPAGPGPHSGNPGSPGMMHGGPPPYGAGAPYGYGPYPPPAYAGYASQPLQPQPYYGGHPYAGYGAYPMYGPDGPMPPPPAYMQRSGSNAGSSGPGSGEDGGMGGPPGPGYGDYGPPPAGMHPMGPGRPMPLSGAGGHPGEGFPAGGL